MLNENTHFLFPASMSISFILLITVITFILIVWHVYTLQGYFALHMGTF